MQKSTCHLRGLEIDSTTSYLAIKILSLRKPSLSLGPACKGCWCIAIHLNTRIRGPQPGCVPGFGSHTAWGAADALIVKQDMRVIGHGSRQRGAAQRALALLAVLGTAAPHRIRLILYRRFLQAV